MSELCEDQKKGDFHIERAPGDKGILFHHRRQLADGQILFLVNTSIEHPSSGVVVSSLRGGSRAGTFTPGRSSPSQSQSSTPASRSNSICRPRAACCCSCRRSPSKPRSRTNLAATLTATGPLEIKRLEPNVLTLDYVDITAGGETKKDVYFYQANQFAWQKNGMDRDPWDSAVQFRASHQQESPRRQRLSSRYKFTIESAVPRNLAIVIERPDLYSSPAMART